MTPERGSKPRIFKPSNKLLSMLSTLKARSNSNRIFSKHFRTQRRLFQKHWKATMLYHQTKDILYVMQFLGHKNIKNTLICIQLEEALFEKENEEFICKVASTVEEAKTLIESGFDYVCEFDGAKLFRKRK